MLNNNFSKLIKLYEKYQRQQRNRMLLRLFALLILIAAVYLVYLQLSKKPLQTISDTAAYNTTAISTPQKAEKVDTTVTSSPAVKKTSVSVPQEKEMPDQITKRTQKTAAKKEEPFQLQVTQRESLYRMLVDYKDKKSYQTAIKIAQFYLLQKEYKKAVKWAVEASKKDPAQARSWIIYAKAKQALGKPDVAKRALAIYLKHNSSKEAQELLNSL